MISLRSIREFPFSNNLFYSLYSDGTYSRGCRSLVKARCICQNWRRDRYDVIRHSQRGSFVAAPDAISTRVIRDGRSGEARPFSTSFAHSFVRPSVRQSVGPSVHSFNRQSPGGQRRREKGTAAERDDGSRAFSRSVLNLLFLAELFAQFSSLFSSYVKRKER